jgi:hypothetical protein
MAKNDAEKRRKKRELAQQKVAAATAAGEFLNKKESRARLRLQTAYNWPVVAAFVADCWADHEAAECLLVREREDGIWSAAFMHIDLTGAGLAAFELVEPLDEDRLESALEHLGHGHGKAVETDPSWIVRILEATARTSAELKLDPHPDLKWARMFAAGIDPAENTEELPIGRDGKLVYFLMPGETEDEAREKLADLVAADRVIFDNSVADAYFKRIADQMKTKAHAHAHETFDDHEH